MISETLAGTNAGVSEVTLSDTSSSKPDPISGAIAENRAESPAEDVRASGPAEQPRQGWWKRRSSETGADGAPLTQVGGEGVRESVKTTTPDAVGYGSQSTNGFAPGLARGEGDAGFRENKAVADSAQADTSPAPLPNGFEGLGRAPDV